MKNVLLVLLLLFAAGCVGADAEDDEDVGQAASALVTGKKLFQKETFGGNGRTCSTCHRGDSGTVSPEEAQDLFDCDPGDPLFRSIDADDGVGSSYSRLLARATFRIPMPLPGNVTMDGDPSIRTVVLTRGTPTTNNVATEDHLMVDGREGADLAHQAGSAVATHYQTATVPTAAEKELIAEFQRTKLFSSGKIRRFVEDGEVPKPPKGHTDSEKRGAVFFDASTPAGKCAQCHSGPMLNTTNAFNGCSVGGPACLPFPAGPQLQAPGDRVSTNFTSEFNLSGLPTHAYTFTGVPGFGTVSMTTSDPGVALASGNPCAPFPIVCFVAGPGVANTVFKIPTLWGINETAPYMHDNSMADLDTVLASYKTFFDITAGGLGALGFPSEGLRLSDADLVDIKAFLLLL